MNEPPTAGAALVTRVFDASRAQVFRALTEPDELAEWYGPELFETPRERILVDLREGGRWQLALLAPDGVTELLIGYEIEELARPRLLAMRSDPLPDLGIEAGSLVRIELFDHGRKTRMTFSDGPLPAEKRAVAEEGWDAAFDDLALHLSRRTDEAGPP